jgi:hypothetical protein
LHAKAHKLSLRLARSKTETASARAAKRKLYTVLAAVLVLGLLVSLAAERQWIASAAHPDWAHFANARVLAPLGEALMISPILAWIIELAATEHLLRHFVEDISHVIVGRLLPPGLQEHLLRYLATDFVRPHWFVQYRIDEWPGKPGFIRIRTFSEWSIENVSGSARKYDFRFLLPQSEFDESTVTSASVSVGGRQTELFAGEVLARAVTKAGDGFVFAKPVEMPAGPHPEYKFAIESVECHPENSDAAFVARDPVLSTKVVIWCDLPDVACRCG